MDLDTKTAAEVADATALIARLEWLPVSRLLVLTRVVVGSATFFDGYTTLAIAFALPVLRGHWHLAPATVGWIISAGYMGQLVGALLFSSLAERIGRLPVLTAAVAVFAAMNIACAFAGSAMAMIAFRFIQGIGTGAEVPVAGAYINEFIGARRRGRFFVLYEALFAFGLMFAGFCGYLLVPRLGWQVMFWVGAVPALLILPLRLFMPESPRWLLSKGRTAEAARIVARMENDVRRAGLALPPPVVVTIAPSAARTEWKELFRGVYRQRTLMLWALWFSAYVINNGLVTWLPTLYGSIFHVPLATALGFGWITSACGVTLAVICAFCIDRVGRRRWYIGAFFARGRAAGRVGDVRRHLRGPRAGPGLGDYAILQSITFSLYLYTAELYPTRMRAIGSGFGQCVAAARLLGRAADRRLRRGARGYQRRVRRFRRVAARDRRDRLACSPARPRDACWRNFRPDRTGPGSERMPDEAPGPGGCALPSISAAPSPTSPPSTRAPARCCFGKALSTHDALVDGIQHTLDGAGDRMSQDAYLFLHGTTIAINTLLERTGAQTALLITEGFRDIYEIGRVNRPDAYNLFFGKHEPLVKRSLRFEVPERLLADGAVHKPLDEDAGARRWRASCKARGVEAVAILLLHSYRNPAHEQRVEADRARGDCPAPSSPPRTNCRRNIASSSAPRPSPPTPMSARASRAYLGELESHLRDDGLRAATSMSCNRPAACSRSAHARRDCVRMLESGPGGRRHRRPGDLRAARPARCHRLRHGRHHGQGRRHHRRQAADDRQRADRRL